MYSVYVFQHIYVTEIYYFSCINNICRFIYYDKSI